jgi:hypothetical protein
LKQEFVAIHELYVFMDIAELIKFISGSAILMAGLTYLAKKFIDKSLEGAVQKYKASLQQDLELYKHTLNKETESLKFELNKISLEYQTKYSALYQERGNIIKHVYGEILNIEGELVKLTSMFQGPDWKTTKNNFSIRDLIFQFEKDFEIKRLYFSKSTCDNVESLIQRMKTINQKMHSAKLQAETNEELERERNVLTGEERLLPKRTWQALELEASTEIKKIRRELEREFAKLIGVE